MQIAVSMLMVVLAGLTASTVVIAQGGPDRPPAPALEAPLDWTVEESDDVTLVLVHEALGARLVVIQLEQLDEVAADVLETTARQLAQSIGNYLGVEEPAVQPVLLFNQPAFEFRTDDGTRTRLQRLFERRGKAFSITVEAPTAGFAAVLPVVEQMLSTLQLFGEVVK